MADRNQLNRRAELERKRIQLAQIREERRRRSQLNQEANENSALGGIESISLGNKSEDADMILQNLGITSSLSRASTVPSNVSSLDQSQRLQSATSPDVSHILSQSSHQNDRSSNSGDQGQSFQSINATPKQSVPLQVVHVNQINIPPKEIVYYTKSTQTALSSSPPPEDESAQGDVQQKSCYGKQSLNNNNNKANHSSTPASGQPHAPQNHNHQLATNQSATDSPNNSSVGTVQQLALEWDDDFPWLDDDPKSRDQRSDNASELRIMSDDERKQVELREDYQQFVDRATKILERALHSNESPEIFIHYFPDDGKDAIDNDQKSSKKLSFNRLIYDEKWSKHRCVTGFDWSAQYPELLLASYHSNEKAPSDPDGTVLVWNTKFKNTSPEYVFHCQSAIVSSCFAKFHPSLIVGGTYSGQIVLWDMRSNKKTPVQRSSLTTAGHTHPVYCAKVVGTQNAHNLISVSTDGKLCSWSLDMLSAPQETMELNQQKQVRTVAVTCISFHPDDHNNFLVGSEEGTVYQACRHGQQQGITRIFDSHQGFITGVDFLPIDTQPGYSHLFLTSSIDWTVKLWDTKLSEPIHTFESYSDYVYDVKWSPTNPALFATADGGGRVDIWNLANDCELPIASTHIEPVLMGESRVQPSLNKLIWTPGGNQVVVGDNVGRIHMYDIGDVGDVSSPRRQEEKWKLGGNTTSGGDHNK